MNSYVKQVLDLGITAGLSLSERRAIRFTNFSLVYGLSFCFVCFIVNWTLIGGKSSLIPLAFAILFGIGFYYQKQNNFAKAKLFTLSLAILGVILSCWIFGLKGYPYFMFLLTFSAGMVFYPHKKDQFRLLWIHLICLTITLIFSTFIQPIIVIPLPFTFGLLTFLFVMILHFIIIFNYTTENQDFENKTNKLVSTLKAKKQQIEQQAIDLQFSNQRLQKEIQEKNRIQEQLEASNEKLHRFVSVASHDLKEPLRSIGGFANILNKELKGQLTDSSTEYFNFITNGVKRMSTLLDDLLVFSKVEKEANFDIENIDLNRLLYVLQYSLNHLIQKNKGKILIKQQLPTIMGNATQINQLFQNLISNALKFKGTSAPIVDISFEETKRDYIFSIKDNGIGIPIEQQTKIFGAFQRLHNRNEYEGTGIGLAICENVVKNHEGRIWLDSKLGVGTTFYFSIKKHANFKDNKQQCLEVAN